MTFPVLERPGQTDRERLARRVGNVRDVLGPRQTARVSARTHIRSAEQRLTDLLRETDQIETMLLVAAAELDPTLRLRRLRRTQRRIDAAHRRLREARMNLNAAATELAGGQF